MSDPVKVTDQVKEGEPKRSTATAKASNENFTAEQQAQPSEKFTTYSGEEPKKVLVAAKPGESLAEFTARTNQYHEEQERKAKEKPAVQPLCIGGFEDGSVITAGGMQKPSDKIEPPAIRHEVAHKAVSVDPRPSYVEGLKAIGNDEEAQGLYSIDYMERKGREALAASQKISPDLDRILVADRDPEHAQVLLAQLNEKAEAGDKPRLQGYVSEPENAWQAFKNLTSEQRTEVIRILNNASQDTIDSMNQQGSDVLHGKPVIDFVLSIDRAVRALGTGAWKDNIAKICQDLQKIATGQPVGQQDPIEKNVTLGAGVLMKGIQGVDQVGQNAHPRAFVKDTHATADAMRQGIGKAAEYYGKKIESDDLCSIPGEAADALDSAKNRATKAVEDFPKKDVSEQSNVLGMGATAAMFFVMGKRILSAHEAATVLGVEESAVATASEEELAAKGLTKIPKDKVPQTRDGNSLQFSEGSTIELTIPTGKLGDSIWPKGWSVRGFEGEAEMGVSGVLAKNFPVIDDAVFSNHVYTSMKTVDLFAPTYQNLEKLEKRLNNCLDKVDAFPHNAKNPWGEVKINPRNVKDKVLQIGIPNATQQQSNWKYLRRSENEQANWEYD